jgi:YidC/Oxa1 family membrane protein insertase
MEKRLLLAFVLSFVVLYGFRYIYPTPPAPPPDKAAVEKKEAAPVEAPKPPVPAEGKGNSKESDEAPIQADAEKDVTIDSNLYVATVSNVGGVLKSFRLKEYLDPEHKPTELIDPYAAKTIGFPLAIATADPKLDIVLSQAKFAITQDGPNKVSVEYRANGVHAQKSFTFDLAKYAVTVSTSLHRNGSAVPHQLVLQGGFGDTSIVPDVPAKKDAVYEAAGSYTRVNLSGIKDGVAQDVTATKIGIEDQFFLAMFLRTKSGPAKINKSDYKLANKDGTEGAAARQLYVAIPSTEPVKIYIGPKLDKSLAAVDPELPKMIYFGWFLFAAIAKPLLLLLRWVHGFVGNWGWAIIVMTILVNLILFPLRVKQQIGMQRLQKLAPRMRTLQDKYKKLKAGDPKRAEVEQELMQMNKQQMAGCLPMLLQMPLLFAFIAMMNAALELRGAPWMLWIQDLSKPDHLYILPISMGVAMFVQMKMSPTSPDPAQAKMMMITPVLVTLLFLWYQSPAGLTIYWLTGNVIGIAQQWLIKNYWKDTDKTDDDGKPLRRGKPEPSPA